MKINKKAPVIYFSLLAGMTLALPLLAWAKPVDLLNTPSASSVHPTASVQLAAARAGHRLICAGERGILLISDDSGLHWRQVRLPVSVAITSLSFPNSHDGWAVGHGGIVLHTVNAGNSWKKVLDGHQSAAIELRAAEQADDQSDAAKRRLRDAQRLVEEGADNPFLAVNFANDKSGMIAGAYGMAFSTEDGGQSWRSMRSAIADGRSRHLYDISRIGHDIYLTGEQGAVYKSTDAGTSFAPIAIPYTGTLFGLISSQDGDLLLYGLRGNVFWSAHGTGSWQKIAIDQRVTLTAGTRLRSGQLILADETGRLLESINNGQTFSALPGIKTSVVSAMAQSDTDELILASSNGPVRQTISQQGLMMP